MKHYLLITLSIILSTAIKAQDSTKTTPFHNRLIVHGFVKTDYWYDSRQVVYAREGLFTLYPKNIELDKTGNDINAESSFNYSAITSRVNLKVIGKNTFGATTFGFIEADFSGMSNVSINSFRLRHAYLQMDWKNSSLLAGQYWHPMFVTEVFPSVISLNTGAPFQPFNRSPQIKYTYRYKAFKYIAAAIAQRDYSSVGPQGRSFSYLSNSLTPNIFIEAIYTKKKSTIGLAYDLKSLRPRQVTDSNIITRNNINSNSLIVYYKWRSNKFKFKTKIIYGQNLADQLMLGGYAVATIDSSIDERTYTNTQHLFIWTNFIFTKKYKNFILHPAIYLGYAKNLGTSETNIGIYYATGPNIDNIYRISPSISLKAGNIMLSLEWENTTVAYGTPDINGKVVNSNKTTNNRLLITAFYFF